MAFRARSLADKKAEYSGELKSLRIGTSAVRVAIG
jgi:hypothetical protein